MDTCQNCGLAATLATSLIDRRIHTSHEIVKGAQAVLDPTPAPGPTEPRPAFGPGAAPVSEDPVRHTPRKEGRLPQCKSVISRSFARRGC